ncbi:MAG TPA: DUF6157 family protein [Caulobacteraceae bacterium]|jgi:hypothetical protein
MHTTNYADAFITVAADCPADSGRAPEQPGGVAGVQYALLRERPYALTSDELLFEAHRRRKALGDDDLDAARAAFFAKPQACLRTSPLAKRYGWGLHHDAHGRVAIYGVESEDYRRLSADPKLKVVAAMRNKRAGA